jgi:hypothetical protein
VKLNKELVMIVVGREEYDTQSSKRTTEYLEGEMSEERSFKNESLYLKRNYTRV